MVLTILAAVAAVVASVVAVLFAVKARSARAALAAARAELDRHGSRLTQADDARQALEDAQQTLESERDELLTARDTALREQDTAIAALGEEQQRRAHVEAEAEQLRQRLHEATVAAELAEATRAAEQADPSEPDPSESLAPAEATEPVTLKTDNAGREPDGCWALLLADIERRWAAVVGAPTDVRGVHLGAVADQLSEALGRETDRLREEVGVDISLTAEQPIDPADPVLFLLAAAELLDVLAINCQKVAIEVDGSLAMTGMEWSGPISELEQARDRVLAAGASVAALEVEPQPDDSDAARQVKLAVHPLPY